MHQLLHDIIFVHEAKIWEFNNDEYKSEKYPWGHTFDIFFIDLFSWKINVSIFEVHASFLLILKFCIPITLRNNFFICEFLRFTYQVEFISSFT